MTFLHKETTGTIQDLVQTGEKSAYVSGTSVTGHLKPLSLEDSTFDIGGISGSSYKFTVKGETILKQGDKFLIGTDLYIVQDYKTYKGISFNTTKFLLVIK